MLLEAPAASLIAAVHASIHHGDTIGKSVGFGLVMRNQNRGQAVLTEIMFDAAAKDRRNCGSS